MLSRSDDNQSEVIKAFNSTSRYLEELLYTDDDFGGQSYLPFRTSIK